MFVCYSNVVPVISGRQHSKCLDPRALSFRSLKTYGSSSRGDMRKRGSGERKTDRTSGAPLILSQRRVLIPKVSSQCTTLRSF